MDTRPRLLFLAQCLPYPPHSGVANRTFNVLRQLRLAYDIDLVAFSRAAHQPDGAARDAAREALGEVAAHVAEPTPVPSERARVRKVWDHLRSLLSGRVYTYYEYESHAFAHRLRTVLRARAPDLVHLDSLDMHRWLPDLPRVPVACTHHDIDSELLRLRAGRLDRAVTRRYLLLQADRAERLQRELCPRVDLNVMMSPLDEVRLRELAPGAVTVVVPNGTDTEYFRPNGARSVAGRVAFVGPTHSFPNRDAVEFLLQEVWPRVQSLDPDASLHLIGRNAPADRVRYAGHPGVTAMGNIPDIRPPLSDARCCVVPIRIGGGTRLKILDAWAMGKAVVSTSIGCEGLDVADGANILVRDTPEALAEGVVQVLHDEQLRARLERNGRRTVTERYSWGSVGQRLRSAYASLLPPRPYANPCVRAAVAASGRHLE